MTMIKSAKIYENMKDKFSLIAEQILADTDFTDFCSFHYLIHQAHYTERSFFPRTINV